MDSAPKFSVLSLILLGLAFLLVNVCASESDFGRCERVVKKWSFSSLRRKGNEDKHTLQDLLFFLHVPRTGGRTYFHCFLRKLYPSSQECPRSYDRLRFDPSKTKCRLLVTHDDYSMMYKLPKERTSMVTILRNPVDRVFSTYEFSIEVAGRFLMHPNLTSATQMAGRLRSKSKGVSTLDIWPWKYLVPWMREDLFARRDARRRSHLTEVKDNDSYDMDEVSMPLHEYINDPIAHEIVHNGATFQVAGLTNNSYLAESHEVRNCVQKYKILGQHVLQVAKKRLDEMLYVGLTEEHRESATLFADMVGAQVISQLREANVSVDSVADNKSDQGSLVSHPDLANQDDKSNGMLDQNTTVSKDVGARKENMTVKELMKAYEGCISSLRKSQSQRRTASLKRISPANFSKEARLKVSEVVLQQIRSLNYLDLELYEHARAIFAKQHEHARQKLVVQDWWGSFNYSYSIMLSKVFSVVMTAVLLFILFFICANSQRRTPKVKI